MKKVQAGLKETQNIQFNQEKSTRNLNVVAKACRQGGYEKSDLHWNKWRGALRARLHLGQLPTCDRKGLKNDSLPNSNHKGKRL